MSKMYHAAMGLLGGWSAAFAWRGLALVGAMLMGSGFAMSATDSSSFVAPLLAQQGMNIGQSWPVIELQTYVLYSPIFKLNVCTKTTDGLSYKLTSSSTNHTPVSTVFNMYYDKICGRIYVKASSTFIETSESGNNAKETASINAIYYGIKSTKSRYS